MKICSQIKRDSILVNCLLKSKRAEKILKDTVSNTKIDFEIINEQYVEYPEADMFYHFIVYKRT